MNLEPAPITFTLTAGAVSTIDPYTGDPTTVIGISK